MQGTWDEGPYTLSDLRMHSTLKPPQPCRHRKADGFAGPEKFHARAEAEIKRWNECVAKSGERACIQRYDPQQLIKGMYAEFVEVRAPH
jgi:hypothetical protein